MPILDVELVQSPTLGLAAQELRLGFSIATTHIPATMISVTTMMTLEQSADLEQQSNQLWNAVSSINIIVIADNYVSTLDLAYLDVATLSDSRKTIQLYQYNEKYLLHV